MIKSDKTWENLGAANPYWGVLTNEQFDRSRITDSDKEIFFSSGDKYIEAIEQDIKFYFGELDIKYTVAISRNRFWKSVEKTYRILK